MGGYGSGCWYRWHTKSTTESQRRIDIRWLKKQEYLQPGISGSLTWSRGDKQTGSINFRMETNYMILNYCYRYQGGDWENVEQTVSFNQTLCNYGGHRNWFLCPRCLKRIAVLYGARKYFLCRHCYGLTYSSRQENKTDRLMRRARKIRERMGGSANLIDSFPDKPKYMHWKTYWRLRERAELPTTLSWLIRGQQLGIHF